MIRDSIGLAIALSLLLLSQGLMDQIQTQPIQTSSYVLAPPDVTAAVEEIREIQ